MLLQDELIEGLSALQPILILDEYTLSLLEIPKHGIGLQESRK